jgi:amino acid transporter
VITGVLTVVLLLLNLGNQRAFFILTSTAIILFYIPYLMVTGPMLVRRLRGQWPTPDHGIFFRMGRWATVVNAIAVLYGVGMTVNLLWPRAAVYGNDHWYYQWGALLSTVVVVAIGAVLIWARRAHWTSSHAPEVIAVPIVAPEETA